jgi:hypothetical protein
MPFLTDLDDGADIKSSRDPLGLVPMSSKFGREVVGNLTTVTSTVHGFTSLLVGLELTDMLREQLRADAPTPRWRSSDIRNGNAGLIPDDWRRRGRP